MPQINKSTLKNHSPEKKPLPFSYYLKKIAEKVEKVWNIVKIIFNWIKRQLESFFSPLFGSRRIERKNPDSEEEKKVEKILPKNFRSTTTQPFIENPKKSQEIIKHQKKSKVYKNNPVASKSNEAPKDSFHKIKLKKRDIKILNTTIQKFNTILKILWNLKGKTTLIKLVKILQNPKVSDNIFTMDELKNIKTFDPEKITTLLNDKITSLNKKTKSPLINDKIFIFNAISSLIEQNVKGNIKYLVQKIITEKNLEKKFKFFALIEAICNNKKSAKLVLFILNSTLDINANRLKKAKKANLLKTLKTYLWFSIKMVLMDKMISILDGEIKTSKKGLKELYFEGFIKSIEKNPEKQQKLRKNLESYINKMNKKFLNKKEEEKKVILLKFLKIIFSQKK